MLVSNCNKVANIQCNCTATFSSYNPVTYATLDVGSLIFTGCTPTQYVIDWHLDSSYVVGSPALTKSQILALPVILISAKSKALNPEIAIDVEHPFSGTGAIIVEFYGKVYPVLRFADIGGQRIYATPFRCTTYCQSLDTNLPAIVINKLECGIVGGSPSAGFDYRIYYGTGGANKNNTFRFGITPPDVPVYGRKYVAFWFAPAGVADTIGVYYKEETTPLYYIKVGGNSGTSDTTTPKQLGANDVKFVIDYTKDRTVQVNDYLRIEVVGSPSGDTIWTLQLKCLDANAFKIGPDYELSECSYFHSGLRQIDASPAKKPTLVYDPTSCSYVVTWHMTSVISPNYANFATNPVTCVSNLCKYNSIDSIRNLTSFDNVATSGTAGKAIGTLSYKRTYYIAAYTNAARSAGSAKYSYYYDAPNNKLTFIFYHLGNYTTVYNNYYSRMADSRIVGSGNTAYIAKTDPLTPECIANMEDMWHYRVVNNFWLNSVPTYDAAGNETWACGDCAWGNQHVINYHVSSPVRFNSGGPNNFTSTGAELRFKAKNRGTGYAAPTIISSTGDLTYIIVNRIPNLVPNPNPAVPRSCANEEGNWQSDSITIWGTNGTLEISVGGIVTTLTVTNNLKTAVTTFASVNYNTYYNAQILLSSYIDFIGIMEITPYNGIRDDFNNYFILNKEEAFDYCTYGRISVARDGAYTSMSGTNSRTLTLNVPPATKWTRGTIVRGKSSGATCEILSYWRTDFVNLAVEPLKYDIKYVVNGTFQAGEILEASTDGGVTWGNEADQNAGAPTISAARASESGSTGCLNGQFTNGWQFITEVPNETCKDFYFYYQYPLHSLNMLCPDYPGDGTGWVQVGNTDRYNVFNLTVEFYRTAEESGLTPTELIDFRENNYRIYNRLNVNGVSINVLKLNVAPNTAWSVGDVIRGQLSGAECTIVSKIDDFSYYVNNLNSYVYRDAEVVGKYSGGVWSNLADQTIGAPRMVGELIYEVYNGLQTFPT